MSIFKCGKVHFLFNGEHVQKCAKQGNPQTALQIEAAHRTTLGKVKRASRTEDCSDS